MNRFSSSCFAFFRNSSSLDRADAITPVLDGVGPMTMTSLRHNSGIAALLRRGLEVPQLW
nr:hypothetical protein [Rhizobium leguminosarum]